MNKYSFSPGLPGIGIKGADASQGIPGLSFWATDMRGDLNTIQITNKISNNISLFLNSSSPLPNGRVYQTGDLFIDSLDNIYQIDLTTQNLYSQTDLTISATQFFNYLKTIPSGFDRYSNFPQAGQNFRLVDNVYSNTESGDYTLQNSQIYNIDYQNYGTINYTDMVDSNNKYNPIALWIGNTPASGIPNKNQVFGLVRDLTNNNLFRLGNTNAGVQQNTNISLDFSTAIFNQNASVNNILYATTGNINNLNVVTENIQNLIIDGSIEFISGQDAVMTMIPNSGTTNTIRIKGQNALGSGLGNRGGNLLLQAGNGAGSALAANGGNLSLLGGAGQTGGSGNPIGGDVSIRGGDSSMNSTGIGYGGNVYLSGGSGYTVATNGTVYVDSSLILNGNTISNGNITTNGLQLSGNSLLSSIIPNVNNADDLGTSSLQFHSIFLDTSVITDYIQIGGDLEFEDGADRHINFGNAMGASNDLYIIGQNATYNGSAQVGGNIFVNAGDASTTAGDYNAAGGYISIKAGHGAQGNVVYGHPNGGDVSIMAGGVIGTNIGTGGNLYLSGGLAPTQGKVYIEGSTNINGKLTINGISVLNSDISINGNEVISGNETINGNTILNGDVSILGNINGISTKIINIGPWNMDVSDYIELLMIPPISDATKIISLDAFIISDIGFTGINCYPLNFVDISTQYTNGSIMVSQFFSNPTLLLQRHIGGIFDNGSFATSSNRGYIKINYIS